MKIAFCEISMDAWILYSFIAFPLILFVCYYSPSIWLTLQIATTLLWIILFIAYLRKKVYLLEKEIRSLKENKEN